MKNIPSFLSLSLLFACSLGLSAEVKDRPNVIFLMTDDQRWNNFGCYGRPEYQTTHIDKLAEQGVIFDKAYYAVSICMPSRVTMMTGRHISSHKVGFTVPYNYTLSEADFTQSYPAMLKKAGYRTGFVGKIGFAITAEAEQPSAPTGYNLKTHYGEYFDFFVGDGTHFQGGFAMWPKDDKVLKKIYRKKRPKSDQTLKVGETMLRFLDTQTKDQPFCLSVSFYAVKPKDGKVHPAHLDIFKNDEFSVPENWQEGNNLKLPKVVQEHWRGTRLHLENSSTLEKYQTLVRRFAAQGYSVDQQVGLMMEKLKERGLLENTIVIYTSDNGRFQGSHGLYDKALLYEDSVKQPLIVFDGRAPVSQGGRRDGSLISSVDIAPTILSLAGVESPKSMQGRDFSGLLDESEDLSQWRDAVLMENLFLVELHKQGKAKNIAEINEQLITENKSYRCRGVRTNRWKYFVYYEQSPPIEELYDLEKDPSELENLAGDSAFDATLVELRKRTEELYLEALK